jgi:3-phosphoshikimate 1-carboxyvinyltransferase
LTGLTENYIQGDKTIADIFVKLGVKTSFLSNSVLLTKKPIQCVVMMEEFFHTPDLFPPAMAACVGLNIPFHFTGLQNLVIKESDRVSAMISELAKFGYYFDYNKGESSLVYDGNKGKLSDEVVTCNSHDDHRIVMSLAPMALVHHGIKISDAFCVGKSYPEFFDDIKRVGFSIE